MRRPKITNEVKNEVMAKIYNRGTTRQSLTSIAKDCGVSQSTVSRIKASKEYAQYAKSEKQFEDNLKDMNVRITPPDATDNRGWLTKLIDWIKG